MLTVTFPPEVEAIVNDEASKQGVDAASLVRTLVEQALPSRPPPSANHDPTLALLRQWQEEDRVITDPIELAKEQREMGELLHALDRHRGETD